ncbi:MAG: hypothetical protein PHI03_13845 [Bacteroidales bacterium]|nr:hypothetical protein [Syntrophomonadaceae bacterium]MDD4674007.1 hypothetical protein [Bacteroidales bacterium]
MKITYKTVNVYVDEKDNLLALPTGESDKYGLKNLDIVFQLSSPYNDSQLEQFLIAAMDKCYSLKADDTPGPTVLEKHLGIKGYAKAVKSRRLVNYDWVLNSGYVVIPTNKKPRQGFVHQEDKTIKLGKELKTGELAKAFREAMQLSTT